MSIYKENDIYKSEELTKFIDGLENKYDIKNQKINYQNSVNFSQNQNVSFHQWFKYREGFSGSLIENLITYSNLEEGDIILDPFSGSGTTLVVANERKYNSYGMDVNPISVLLSNVKIFNYEESDLILIDELITKFNENFSIGYDEKVDEFNDVKRYFNDGNFASLLGIRKFIDDIENQVVKDFFMCSFISIIENASNRKRDGNGLKTVKTKVNNVKLIFMQKLNEMFNDVMHSGIDYSIQDKEVDRTEIFGECVLGSAVNLSEKFERSQVFDNDKNRAIIFSPPYPNSFDYFESYKMELVFGGFVNNIKEIKEYRKNAVRSFVGVHKQESYDVYIDLIADEIEAAIIPKEQRTGKKDLRTRRVPSMIRGYFADMWDILKECNKCLKIGNMTYIVVDQSSYLGVIVPTDLLLAYFAEKSGFRVINIMEARKARTSPQQMKQFPYLKNGLRESIIELKKVENI